ncbi:acyltransferase domain-containing protein [uncultured Dubosiella sp.]|uniref:acyltransferase domain-containing protein n=4 Tax=uncultured Dubosiella sp. TaxID=1937011 RepID=UPI0025B547BF|nr:acyltransferase domain-containing protein [uncultured Dubosiella sp.]
MKDALAALELARQTGMPKEVLLALQVQSETLELTALEPLLSALGDPAQSRQAYIGLKTALGEDADGWKMLWCQLVCASRQRKRYETDEVYIETMKAFSRFVNECRRRTGKYRFDRGWWTWRQVSDRVVRLGALEYEKRTREGQKVIDIHIPSDASLVPERVDASLEEARRYFDDSAKIAWTCDSWLLSPALRPLLPKDSNIRAFQDRFAILATDKTDDEFIEWLYQMPVDTPIHSLPGQTTLQRAVQCFLIQGGKIGSALGVLC